VRGIRIFGVFLGLSGLTQMADASDILAKADIGYGEYLAAECVTCHQKQAKSDGIPAIVGLDAETFATVLHEYKLKNLDNQVMQMIAGRLDDEQIASLAVYFASLPAAD